MKNLCHVIRVTELGEGKGSGHKRCCSIYIHYGYCIRKAGAICRKVVSQTILYIFTVTCDKVVMKHKKEFSL